MSGAADHPAALLATRRQLLVAQSRLQRAALQAQWQRLQQPPAWVAPAQRLFVQVRARPWLLVLPAAAMLAAKPSWIWRLGAGGLAAYRALRFARRWL